jgi:hypothetical protein
VITISRTKGSPNSFAGAELLHPVSEHARLRMTQRRVPFDAVHAALELGRTVYTRGACFHVIGRKEVERYEKKGIDLSPYEGVHVVCSSDGCIATTYRSRSLRELRPRRRTRRSHWPWKR